MWPGSAKNKFSVMYCNLQQSFQDTHPALVNCEYITVKILHCMCFRQEEDLQYLPFGRARPIILA